MKYKNVLIVVRDMQESIAFYKKVLGLHVIMDFGANVTMTGGFFLQTLDTWKGFIDNREVVMESNSFELYFEEDDFDSFLSKISKMDIDYVQNVIEAPWGQRTVRIFDPNKNIIEIGENIKSVCKRFLSSGMTDEEVMKRMDVPLKFVVSCKK